MLDSLTAAHASGYDHGLVAGFVAGMVFGCTAAFGIAACIVAADEPRSPLDQRFAEPFERPQLRVIRGGRR